MAQLPSLDWLIQQIDGEVILFNRFTEEEIVKFDPSNADDTAKAQKVIFDSRLLSTEDKCFAHFWSGYFYRNATFHSNSVIYY